ncbi:hypothetical protein [Novosphingobium fuchskuhlense]|nr:hypothetical protein [Novosphingobium fuchskuhlense]
MASHIRRKNAEKMLGNLRKCFAKVANYQKETGAHCAALPDGG